jgi:hypothetical protein
VCAFAKIKLENALKKDQRNIKLYATSGNPGKCKVFLMVSYRYSHDHECPKAMDAEIYKSKGLGEGHGRARTWRNGQNRADGVALGGTE